METPPLGGVGFQFLASSVKFLASGFWLPASGISFLTAKRRCLKIVKETIERQRLFHLAKIVEKGGLFKP